MWSRTPVNLACPLRVLGLSLPDLARAGAQTGFHELSRTLTSRSKKFTRATGAHTKNRGCRIVFRSGVPRLPPT